MTATYRIEYSDDLFRLVIMSGGQEDFDEAVPYCAISSIVGPDGKVYGAYLSGSEIDLDTLSNHPTDVEMVATMIRVFEIVPGSQPPVLRALDSPVTIVETDFEGVEGEDEDEGAEEESIDVRPL